MPRYEVRVVAIGVICTKREFEAQGTDEAVSMLPTLFGDQYTPVSPEEAIHDLVLRLYQLGQSNIDADQQVFACPVKINLDHKIEDREEVVEFAKIIDLLGISFAPA